MNENLKRGLAITAATLITAMLVTSMAAQVVHAQTTTHPLFSDCSVDQHGNIIDCPVRFEEIDELNYGFGAGDAQFYATIEDTATGGGKRPYVIWLYRNGYATNQEDELDNVRFSDVNTSDAVLTALEEHSTCELTADVASHGEFTVKTTVGDFTYNDEPTWERHAKDLMRSPVTVTADQIRINRNTGEVQCRFDMAEILNKGIEVNGEFLSWNGRQPVIGDETGSMGEISITYSTGPQAQPNGTLNSTDVYVIGGHINVTGGDMRFEGGNITVEQVGEKKEGESWFESAVSGIMDVVGGDGITGGILRALSGLFISLVRTIHTGIWTLITWTPNVTGNPAVAQIHQLSLAVSGLLAVIVLMAGGVLHMTGWATGTAYVQIRFIVPRVIAALAFGAVSLPLLQYGVELAQVLTQVFMPFDSMTLEGFLSYSAAAILVYIVDAVLLLLLVLIFVMRGVFILLVAAVSPLLALGWAFPYTNPQAQRFISAWWAALAMAPAEMIVLRFIVTLPQYGGDPAGTIGNWVYALAASFMLIAVPWQMYQASGMIAGPAANLAYGARNTFHQYGGFQGIADRLGRGEDIGRKLDRWERQQMELYRSMNSQMDSVESDRREAERTPAHDRGFDGMNGRGRW